MTSMRVVSEWSRSFTIVDESTVNRGEPRLVVNCFQKKYVEWLPQANEGDVVILRNLKVRLLFEDDLLVYSTTFIGFRVQRGTISDRLCGQASMGCLRSRGACNPTPQRRRHTGQGKG